MTATVHNYVSPVDDARLYERYPHSGDCTDTLCTACGCCTHCKDDGHCEGAPGCAARSCGCEYARDGAPS